MSLPHLYARYSGIDNIKNELWKIRRCSSLILSPNLVDALLRQCLWLNGQGQRSEAAHFYDFVEAYWEDVRITTIHREVFDMLLQECPIVCADCDLNVVRSVSIPMRGSNTVKNAKGCWTKGPWKSRVRASALKLACSRNLQSVSFEINKDITSKRCLEELRVILLRESSSFLIDVQ